MSPLRTVLDDSIGCAVWFAARGEGRIAAANGHGYLSYASTARVGFLSLTEPDG